MRWARCVRAAQTPPGGSLALAARQVPGPASALLAQVHAARGEAASGGVALSVRRAMRAAHSVVYGFLQQLATMVGPSTVGAVTGSSSGRPPRPSLICEGSQEALDGVAGKSVALAGARTRWPPRLRRTGPPRRSHLVRLGLGAVFPDLPSLPEPAHDRRHQQHRHDSELLGVVLVEREVHRACRGIPSGTGSLGAERTAWRTRRQARATARPAAARPGPRPGRLAPRP